jgi:hypothetical protein
MPWPPQAPRAHIAGLDILAKVVNQVALVPDGIQQPKRAGHRTVEPGRDWMPACAGMTGKKQRHWIPGSALRAAPE